MCLNPRILKIAKREFATCCNQENYVVNCGKCAECQAAKKSEYYFRSYCQAKETFDKGGFILFETLTLRDKYLPRKEFINENTGEVNEFPYFDRDLITNFWKRLRINMERDGYDVKDKLKYFLTAEYGDRYHRPHFHFNCFCTIPGITPIDLKKYINLAWRGKFTLSDSPLELSECDLGITDKSYGDKGLAYRTITDISHLGVFDYIAKYVQKDSEHEKWLADNFDNNVPKELKTFHRSSRGYGLHALKMYSHDDFFNGTITMPDRKHGYRSVSPSMYFQRKLFYELKKRNDGSVYWVRNQLGQSRKIAQSTKVINQMAERYATTFQTIQANNVKLFGKDDMARTINTLLDGRSWNDVARYVYWYRGRTLDSHFQDGVVPLAQLWITGQDEQLFLMECDSFRIQFDDTDQYRDFLKRNEHSFITENSLPDFYDFDKILDFMSIGMTEFNERKQRLFDEKQRVKKLLNNR